MNGMELESVRIVSPCISYLQTDREIAPKTQQHRIGSLRNLLKVEMREGLLETNVFEGLVIATPAGSEEERG